MDSLKSIGVGALVVVLGAWVIFDIGLLLALSSKSVTWQGWMWAGLAPVWTFLLLVFGLCFWAIGDKIRGE